MRRSTQKGGLGDDVAQNIRAEMNRDAMPSEEEVRAERRHHLAEEGCKVCGEDDPENLRTQMPHTHSCPAVQSPRVEPEVVCDEHEGDAREAWLADEKERLNRENAAALVVYECDITVTVTEDDGDESEVPPQYREAPSVSVACRCGAEIDEIHYPADS